MAAYLDISSGDAAKNKQETIEYNATCSLLSKHAAVFELPELPELLSDEQRGILQDLNVHRRWLILDSGSRHSCQILLYVEILDTNPPL